MVSREGAQMMLITGDISYKVEISCHLCGRQALSRHSTRLIGVPIDHVKELLLIDSRSKTPDIPVGWSMSGRDRISCDSCERKVSACHLNAGEVS